MGQIPLVGELMTKARGYSDVGKEAAGSNVRLSEGLNIQPPRGAYESEDASKMFLYYNSGNLCWLLGLFLVIVLMAILGGVLDAGLTVSWTNEGSGRLNDRHVPVTSIHKGTVRLEIPAFKLFTNASTSSTPSIWRGRAFFTTWDGRVIAVEETTGVVLWSVNLCIDVYGLSAPTCDYQANVLLRYLTVATPSIWKDKIVVMVRQPAEIVVLEQDSGDLWQKASVGPNYAMELTQSGSVWDDSIYFGTSIAEADIAANKNTCNFTGTVYRWNLDMMVPTWSTSTNDPNGLNGGAPSGFTGMPVRGSSPALSPEEDSVVVAVGPLICQPSWFTNCVGTLCQGNETTFNVSGYRNRYDSCYDYGTASRAMFNSILVLRMTDGSMRWHEKLIGHRAWNLACEGYDLPDPCRDHLPPTEPCDFEHNPYSNCPTEYESCFGDYDWTSDPALQIHANNEMILYAMHKTPIVHAMNLKVDVPNADDPRFRWSTHVAPNATGGGVAVNKDYVYFSFANDRSEPWTYNDGLYTTCGGWGAVDNGYGLPIWYVPHPRCNQTSCTCPGEISPDVKNGGRSPPTVTNDLVLVTSSDDPDEYYGRNRTTSCGGYVYALCSKTGFVVSRYETGVPFGKQGVSVHDRCAFAGHGESPAYWGERGTYGYGWCVANAYGELA